MKITPKGSEAARLRQRKYQLVRRFGIPGARIIGGIAVAAQNLNRAVSPQGVRARAGAAALILGTLSFLLFGCVERTVAPVNPLADMHGTWKGTRTKLVFDNQGTLIPDTTVVTDLTLVLTPGSIGFIDSEAGQLPTSITSIDNNGVVFTVTNGLALWT